MTLSSMPVTAINDVRPMHLLAIADAQRLTDDVAGLVKAAVGSAASMYESIAAVASRIPDLYFGQAWVALGYTSWSEYTRGEFGTLMAGLPATIRRELSQGWAASGMAPKEIAGTLKVPTPVTRRDLGLTKTRPKVAAPRNPAPPKVEIISSGASLAPVWDALDRLSALSPSDIKLLVDEARNGRGELRLVRATMVAKIIDAMLLS